MLDLHIKWAREKDMGHILQGVVANYTRESALNAFILQPGTRREATATYLPNNISDLICLGELFFTLQLIS